MKKYDRIENIVLTVINDGNGSECGFTYEERLAMAENGILNYRGMCGRVAANHEPRAGRQQIILAANQVQAYYRQHAAEIKRLNKMEGKA